MKLAEVRVVRADIPVKRPQPARYAEGCVLALDGPGLGVEVDEAALKEWTRRR